MISKINATKNFNTGAIIATPKKANSCTKSHTMHICHAYCDNLENKHEIEDDLHFQEQEASPNATGWHSIMY